MLEGVDDFNHLNTVAVGNFLRVARVRDRLVFVVLQSNVTQLRVRNVLHVNPLDAERTLPLVLRPDARIGIVIHRRDHLGHATEMTGAVD